MNSYSSASLYVGDLNPDVGETQLFEIFKQVGPVASIRVCRDSTTRRSLGYAYVNYLSLPDAMRALDLFNFQEIKGRPCRIMWSQRDPSLRKTGSGNIFIKNLDKSIDNKILYDTFSTFGNILSCKISVNEQGISRGFGFVHYETHEAAEEAIAKTNEKLLKNKKIYVGFFVTKKERDASDAASPKWTNIFVKNLSKTVTDEKFREIFDKFGPITSAIVVKDSNGTSKGFGFVNYEVHDHAKAAIEALNGNEIDEMKIFVGRAQKKSDREKELREMFEKLKRERMNKYQGVNLYVKNLDENIDDAKLRQEFSSCGTITSAKVMTDEKGSSKGFGFVCFSTPDEATKAVTEMNSKMIANKPIYVALAQRKELRRAQLEAQHAVRANGIRMQQQAQASGMTGSPLYAPGTPVFYAPQQLGRNNFVYPRGFTGYPAQQAQRPGYPQSSYNRPPAAGNQRGGRRGGAPKGSGRDTPQVPGYPGIKYTSNVRNPQQPNPTEGMTNEDQRQYLGETLYPLVINVLKEKGLDDSLAGKITGMVLELESAELLGIIESPEALQKKIGEALDLLDQANK